MTKSNQAARTAPRQLKKEEKQRHPKEGGKEHHRSVGRREKLQPKRGIPVLLWCGAAVPSWGVLPSAAFPFQVVQHVLLVVLSFFFLWVVLFPNFSFGVVLFLPSFFWGGGASFFWVAPFPSSFGLVLLSHLLLSVVALAILKKKTKSSNLNILFQLDDMI